MPLCGQRLQTEHFLLAGFLLQASTWRTLLAFILLQDVLFLIFLMALSKIESKNPGPGVLSSHTSSLWIV